MAQKILIGTTNIGKQAEFKRIITEIQPDTTLFFPQSLGIKEKPEETGATFVENSLLKAQFYYYKSGIPTIADDGGLEIPILNNEPGVYSRRWLGYEASDEEILNYTLKRLEKYTSKSDRKAYLKTCITYYDGKVTFQENEKIAGYISKKSHKTVTDLNGYPFRSLFIVTPIEKYYDELSQREHDLYNHREKALKRLWNSINLNLY